MQRLGLVVKGLTELLPLVGVGSDVGQAVLKAIQALSKFVPPGSVTPAGERQQIDRMSMANSQNNSQMQALRQRLMQQGGGAGGGQPGAGGPGAAA
jgi:hypothetical protein